MNPPSHIKQQDVKRLRIAVAGALALVLALFGCIGCGPAASDVLEGSLESHASDRCDAIEEQQGNDPGSPGDDAAPSSAPVDAATFDYSCIPAFDGQPYVALNGNNPSLTAQEADALISACSSPAAAESYALLDALGRCGAATAVVSRDTQPTEPRESIGMIKPSGWHTVRYDELVDGKYLYNRCHLIGYQLTGENANERNLITGTRYLNTEGMLPFENWVDDHVDRGGRVLMRVEPVFVDSELVARGVHMEALSLDDDGAAVRFNVFCYNVQPGVAIDYATGNSWRDSNGPGSAAGGVAGDSAVASTPSDGLDADPGFGASPGSDGAQGADASEQRSYVLNTNTHKFHVPGCKSIARMKPRNKREVTLTRNEALAQGYEPCALCNP